MESSLFEATWWEGTIVISAAFTALWAVGLFLYSVMATISAFKRNYSRDAIVLYWLYFVAVVAFTDCEGIWSGIAFFGLMSPLITLGMYLFERNRKLQL